ncbi:MAG: DUF2070 family protein [Candidatus Methanomethylicaceae archaeon]
MSFTDRLAKKYSNTFSLPSRKVLIAELFMLGALVGTIMYTIEPSSKGPVFGLADGLISLAFGSFVSTFVIHKLTKKGILTFNRTIAMADFSIVFLAIGLITAAAFSRVFNNPGSFESIYFVSCGIIVAFIFIILSIASDFKQYELFILSIFQPFVILIIHTTLIYFIYYVNLLNIVTNFASFFLMAIIAYVLGRWYYFSIGKVGKELLGYSGVVLFKAFLESLMLDKSGLMEQLLKILAVREDVEVRSIYFKSTRQNGVVVAPLIHPGPFKDLGSSKLPTRIAASFLSKNTLPVVFHTPTTHEKDLILAKDCDRVVQMLQELEVIPERSLSKPIIVKKKGSVTVSCQVFDDIPLAVITRAPIPTEDLPDCINDLCMAKIQENGYSDGVVVDAHNVMDLTYSELSSEDKKDIVEALGEALEETHIIEEGPLIAGFSNVRLENYSPKDGIGNAGIMVLVTEVKGNKAVYVSIDANNMVVGLREKIQKALKEIGYEHSEVTTTDTHVVTGRSAGEGYFPLGKTIPEDVLIEKIIEGVAEADSKKAECSVKFSKRKLEDVYLLGNKGLENLWKVTDKSLKVAKRRLMVLVLLLLASGIIVYSIL